MKYLFFVSYMLIAANVNSQIRNVSVDTLSINIRQGPKQFSKALRTPLLLIGAGVYAMSDNDVLSRYEFKEERDEYFPTFRHRADDYLQFAPIVAVYGLNALGIKGKHDFRTRSMLLLKSELIMTALTFSLKKITAVPRPDTGQPTSFPSGHTAQAFAAATFMVKEYGDRSVLYSIGAYSLASGIGVMRVMNNRHWISDVLAGAGIGILSTNLAYFLHDHSRKGKGKRHASLILPSYDGQAGSITLIKTL